MSSRHSENFLEKDGLIKRCPVDQRALVKLVKRAHTDLKTVREIYERIRNVPTTMLTMPC
jgi:hypothetical protein